MAEHSVKWSEACKILKDQNKWKTPNTDIN
jgi:hypothetical protein